MGLRCVPLVILLGMTAALAPQQAAAWTQYVTSSGAPLHWPSAVVHYAIATDLPGELTQTGVQRAFADAFEAWASLPCRPFTTTFDGYDGALVADGGDGQNALVWIHAEGDWLAQGFGVTELARTGVTHRVNSGEIIDADIQVNVAGFTYAEAPVCDPDAYDLQSTLTHEVGHLFGLDHATDPDSTMAARTDPGECTKRTLSQDDIDGFCATYEPYAPADPGPEASGDAIGSDAAGGDTVVGRPPSRETCGAGGAGTGLSLIFAAAWLLFAGLRRRSHPWI